ncbi:hypothetical protein V8G54_004357 [Vigna mungo]|uniref:Uncharacterized protein n=1 Tax=Vigna mungo TaxID=3915 RepID=A0AAQ3PCG3_VIGMU
MNDSPDHSPSSASTDSSSHFNSIVMVSLSDSLDPIPQEVFQTPPEAATDGNDPYAVNHAAGVEAGTQGFVDLCEGSELGFSEVQLKQEMDVGEYLHGAPRDVLGETRDGRFDEFVVSDGELSHSGKSPAKKSKLSEVDLDMDSSEGCVKVLSEKGEEGMGNCEGKLVSEAEEASDCSSAKILETAEKVAESNSSDGVVEGSGKGMDVFEVLRFLSEISNEKKRKVDNYFWYKVADACGVFPRPRWWPEGEDFDTIDDDEEDFDP